jgi:predicted TIM-barrel fold metal-dependent hydrolase
VLRGFGALALVAGCAREEVRIVDAHVHLTDLGALPGLVATLDRHGVERAVLIATPSRLAERARANEDVLAAAARHPDRFLPFVALDLASDAPEALDALLARGACGVKLYQGHADFHERPLDDPAHEALWQALEARGTPVLLHVNTVRFGGELDRTLTAHPRLNAVCAHLCGSRTDLDRFEALARRFPRLLFDTSHGSASHAAAGFANLDRERARFRRLVESEPDRFLFGSDLVPITIPGWRVEWDGQLAANIGLLRAERFAALRAQGDLPALVPGEYRGLALPPPILRRVLRQNAQRWLAPCL